MSDVIAIQRATADDSYEVAVMVGELLTEISDTIGVKVFNFDLDDTAARLRDFLNRDKYFVFVARQGNTKPIGFIALCESYALYAEGVYGTIPELYVRPLYRSKNVGMQLIYLAKTFAASRGWKRLEVTTPPLPQFSRTLTFYEREGFAVTGGRKLKLVL